MHHFSMALSVIPPQNHLSKMSYFSNFYYLLKCSFVLIKQIISLNTRGEKANARNDPVANYYDQSHMINDFRCFTGYSPKEYFSACASYSDYFN